MPDTRESLITLMTTPYQSLLAKLARLLEFILEQPEGQQADVVVDMMRYWMLPDQDMPEIDEETPISPDDLAQAKKKLGNLSHGSENQLRRRYRSSCIAFDRDRPALEIASAILRDLRHAGEDIGTSAQVCILAHITGNHLPYLDMDLPTLVPKLMDMMHNLAEEQRDLFAEILFVFGTKVTGPDNLPAAAHWLQLRTIDLGSQAQRAAWAFALQVASFHNSSGSGIVGIVVLKPPDSTGKQTKGNDQ